MLPHLAFNMQTIWRTCATAAVARCARSRQKKKAPRSARRRFHCPVANSPSPASGVTVLSDGTKARHRPPAKLIATRQSRHLGRVGRSMPSGRAHRRLGACTRQVRGACVRGPASGPLYHRVISWSNRATAALLGGADPHQPTNLLPRLYFCRPRRMGIGSVIVTGLTAPAGAGDGSGEIGKQNTTMPNRPQALLPQHQNIFDIRSWARHPPVGRPSTDQATAVPSFVVLEDRRRFWRHLVDPQISGHPSYNRPSQRALQLQALDRSADATRRIFRAYMGEVTPKRTSQHSRATAHDFLASWSSEANLL